MSEPIDELEKTLLNDTKFQHILKFAPASQRELMTFELAQYFQALIQRKETEAREDEVRRTFAYPKDGEIGYALVTQRLAELHRHSEGGEG